MRALSVTLRTLLPTAALVLLGCGDPAPRGADAGTDDPDGGVDRLCPDPATPAPWPAPRDLEVSPSDAWSATIGADSPLLTGGLAAEQGLRWAKWSLSLEDPDTVYFQDSRAYPFHYDFVTSELDPFAGIDRSALDAITLRTDGRTLALGAVLFPTDPSIAQVGVQIVSEDPLPAPLVVDLFERVAVAIDAPGAEIVYVPAGGQEACADAHRDWLAERGVRVVSADAWLPGDQCYASGWAVGRVVQLASSEVEQAALDGSLQATDVLLLEDAAPAELPPVAGILSLAPSTPSSHTAILAQSYGIPFAYLRQPESAGRAEALVGSTVGLGATTWYGGSCEVRLIDLDAVPAAIVQQLRAMTTPPPLEVPAKVHRGVFAVDVDALGPADIASVGGKAAHYGVLRDVIPEASRPAVALTMDLWDAVLDQEIEPGLTLRADIEARLGGFSWPPPMAELDAALADVRATIRTRATFPPAVRAEVEAALAGFDPTARLRFRSSSNAEDGATFTGAGLYESFSGCLADELDGDDAGPSACDTSKPAERGIYRALRKVYASFYRRNAFLERLRRQVDEAEVGMAVLVHHSFPDHAEQANGVAVLARSFSDRVELVSQPGAISVTNPEGGAAPEEVRVERYEFGSYPALVRGAALLPLGDTVLAWDEDYLALTELLARVADVFGDGTAPFTLDFEYKQVEPGELVVKQVRPLPLPDTTRDVTPLLVDAPVALCVLQGEYGDVFANHRQKSLWRLRTRTAWLTEEALSTTLLSHLELAFVDGGALAQIAGTPGELPGFVHERSGGTLHDGFRAGSETSRRLTVQAAEPELRGRDQLPAMLYDELYLRLQVDTDEPVPYVEYEGTVQTRTREHVKLTSVCPERHQPTASDQRIERALGSGGIAIDTAFYWPAPPTGPQAGYTAPLVAWDRTTITGLTTAPIVLTSPWAQTTRPEHHNFGASYLFEPALDPDLDATTRAELEAANVRLLYATESGTLLLIGFDGTFRTP